MATLARQSIQLENPSIGGRNLAIGTKEFTSHGTYALETGERYNGCLVRKAIQQAGNTNIWEMILSDYKLGDYFTLSFWARGTSTSFITFFHGDAGYPPSYVQSTDCAGSGTSTDGRYTHKLTTDWKRHFVTWKISDTGDATKRKIALIRMDGSDQTQFAEVCGIKFEKGSVATDWTPAPEDKADQAIIDNWTSDAIKDGVTKINGGYIQTQTINSSHLIVEDIFATGSAAMNLISARELNADLITSGTINANFLSLYGLQVLNKTTNQQTLNITENGEITLRGSVESYNYNDGKTGWAIKQNGDAEFNDVVVRGSVITNDGGIVSSGGSGRNLLLNSYSNKTNASTSYPCGTYTLARKVTAGEKYTFSVNAEFTGATTLALYFGGGSYGTQWVNVPGNGTHTISFSFTANSNMAAQSVAYLYVRDAQNQASFTQGSCKIVWAKLEEGTVATAWSPAPEDNLKQVRFWAGASYDEREAAPWIVYNDGSMVATKGTFSGVFSGDIKIGNISITDPSSSTGNDAILTITNGSTGVEAVQLTDRGTSVFRQSVVFRSASAGSTDTTISLEPNGTGVFKSSVQVGSGANVAGLENDKLVIRGHTLTHNSSGLQSNSDFFVGEAAHKKNLKTYGDMYATGVVRTDDMVLFADKAQMKIVANGLNIDVFNS